MQSLLKTSPMIDVVVYSFTYRRERNNLIFIILSKVMTKTIKISKRLLSSFKIDSPLHLHRLKEHTIDQPQLCLFESYMIMEF